MSIRLPKNFRQELNQEIKEVAETVYDLVELEHLESLRGSDSVNVNFSSIFYSEDFMNPALFSEETIKEIKERARCGLCVADFAIEEFERVFKKYGKKYIKQDLKNMIEGIIQILITNEKIAREISIVDTKTFLDTLRENIGIHWSWDYKASKAYWGQRKHENTATFNIEFDIMEEWDKVDWKETLFLNYFSDFISEREIRLIQDKKLKVTSIRTSDNILEIEVAETFDFKV
jgi:hypothetical protein